MPGCSTVERTSLGRLVFELARFLLLARPRSREAGSTGAVTSRALIGNPPLSTCEARWPASVHVTSRNRHADPDECPVVASSFRRKLGGGLTWPDKSGCNHGPAVRLPSGAFRLAPGFPRSFNSPSGRFHCTTPRLGKQEVSKVVSLPLLYGRFLIAVSRRTCALGRGVLQLRHNKGGTDATSTG